MADHPRNPYLTVDAIVTLDDGSIVLVERKNPPHGWALPGGFVDYGETLEAAVRRELDEETGLVLDDLEQFRAYSDPARDPRFHTVSVVFTARSSGTPRGGDDAKTARGFAPDALPEPMCFDHDRVIADWLAARKETP